MAYIDSDLDPSWDDPPTPVAQVIQPVIDPNGWHWYPDANGQLFTLYFDADDNECMMWQLRDDGSFYWRCANVGYNCRDIGIEGRMGIFFDNLLVGTMVIDEYLTVAWLPETYINNPNIDNIDNIDNINNINNYININYIENIHYNIDHDNINYINEIDDIDESENDDFDP
jgi:hypothetical protein